MPTLAHCLLAAAVAAASPVAATTPLLESGPTESMPAPPFPESPRDLSRSTSYGEMATWLEALDGHGPLALVVAGTSNAGRAIYAARLSRGSAPTWRVLFYAQQHGDELSGKDALLYLIRDLVREPKQLPRDVELWILPMVNPDGAEAGTRRNAAGADLNRDHLALDQPETRALHGIVRQVRPHLAVDCHEFARESEPWSERGWSKWPDITMDSLNNPLFDSAVVAAAERRVGEAAALEARAGHPFLRYWVGGVPPDDEQRHSAPDIDAALNAVGMYGGLSLIIEAAARHDQQTEETTARELGSRVDAYLVVLRNFLGKDPHRDADRAAIEHSRRRLLPAFLPTNYFWVNPRGKVSRFPVLETATGRTIEILTPNLMTELAIKRSVPTPLGYAVEPAAADELARVLDRHAIPYERLPVARAVRVETCTLLRLEEEFDEVYSRYEGRQIVRREKAASLELPAGSLWIPLAGESAVRAALVLEPSAMYGLYQIPRFRALAAADGKLPVLRVVR